MVRDSHRLDLNSTADCTMNGGVRFDADDTQRWMYEFPSCEKCEVHFLYYINFVVVFTLEDVLLVEFMYLVFTPTPGESYRRRLRPLLLYLCYVFRALMNSLVC